MLFIIGFIVVFGCVASGYLMDEGKLSVLWQPNEVVIIVGAATGAFFIANPMPVVKGVGKSLKFLLKGKPYKKSDYLELLTFLFTCFKTMKSKGMLAIESHIENPHESDIFKRFPGILHDHHIVEFFCDYLRLLTMGVDNPHHLEDLIEKEIELHHHEGSAAAAAITNTADGMPALGIVAAVLGVINTMKSISEPPEVLGGLIAAALCGTFMGVLLSYGIIAPIGQFIGKYVDSQTNYLQCIKVALVAYLQGTAPTVIVEFVRKSVPGHERPSFKETEDAINGNEKG